MSSNAQPKPTFEHAVADFFNVAATSADQAYRLWEKSIARETSESDPAASVFTDFTESYIAFVEELSEHPEEVLAQQVGLQQNLMNLYQQTTLKFLGHEAEEVKAPEKGDKRFSDPEWTENILFDYIKQFYLIVSDFLVDLSQTTGNLSEHAKDQMRFFTRQFVNAMSPTNNPLTNPEVLRKTIESGGENLAEGMEHLISDLGKSFGGLNVSMTDMAAFKVGRNVATTPGKIIYQNDLIQLIQYEPTTPKAHKTPLLVIPPFINKFYILDLRQQNSFLKWLVDQGHSVFCISWINPGPSLRDKGFENYMMEGPMAALDAIKEATGESDVNAIGYCLGGTLLAATLGYMKRKKDKRIKSATYMATLIDFYDPGEIGVFINETAISALERQMNALGYYDGRQMAFSFNLLRENDLFWSFFINNYLKGERPAAFDLLFWNSDGTNLPAKMHSFYLRNMYLENKLKDPNGIELCGEKIDLTDVDTPSYFISTAQDHIAKWKSTYAGARLFKGDVRFVLGGSGHIAGIVNPPAANKYGFWTAENLPENPDEWYKTTKKEDGSWWPDWDSWVGKFVGKEVDSRKPGSGKLKPLMDAPGDYVTKKVAQVVNS